ncbi:MAG: type II secretion system F family protein [Planctomycetaceae bacterium]|jgi:type II secretory pathway component PulF|nr:type II secretion system F family protein [Planctomycetaceae bacterium]
MPQFQYKISKNGTISTGNIEADNANNAAIKLRSQGMILQLVPATVSSGINGNRNPLSILRSLIRPAAAHQEIYLRQLSSLLQAGVPILTALEAVGEQAPKRIAVVFAKLTERVRSGASMKKSLEEEAPFFGKVSIGLIGVGEANGTLDEMFAYASDLMERNRKVKGQIIQTFSYPAIVMCVAVGIAYYMVAYVLPTIMAFITKQSKTVAMPLTTKLLIALNDLCMNSWAYFIIVPVCLVVICFLLRRNPQTVERFDLIMLYIPLIGKAIREHSNTLWTRTLGALIRSGVDITAALELVEGIMSNRYYAAQIRKVRETVKQGGSLTKAVKGTALRRLCPMSTAMLGVSEESGSIDASLLHVADYCEEQLTRRVVLLSKFVEPAIFGFIGGFVGFIYFAFFMAMLAATRAV